MRAIASGSNLVLPAVNPPSILRPFQSTAESSYWMLPSEKTFADEVLCRRGATSFTKKNLTSFLESAGAGPRATRLYDRVKNLTLDLSASTSDPGVPVHIWVGTGTDTPHAFYWANGDSFDQQPLALEGLDGDGVVPLRSANAVEGARWARLRPTRAFKGVTHKGLVRAPELVAMLVALVSSEEPQEIEKGND